MLHVLKSVNMKKIILTVFLGLLFSSTVINSQDRELKFSTALIIDPNATIKDGFNIGISLDYQMTLMYFKLQAFYFPKLNNVDYLELSGVLIGFNYHNNRNLYRVYSGFKLGTIRREQNPFPMIGIESGLDINFSKKMYLGLMATYNYRIDGKIWESHSDPYWRLSGFVKIGYRFN